MKFQKPRRQIAGPSSAIGLMRFFDTEMAGPKISPEFVFIVSVLIVLAVLAIKLLG